MKFERSKLYATSQEGGVVAGLVDLNRQARTVKWTMPAGRVRAYDIAAVLVDTDDAFTFEDSQGRTHEMRPLTPELYNQLRPASSRNYPTTRALLYAYWLSLGYRSIPPWVLSDMLSDESLR